MEVEIKMSRKHPSSHNYQDYGKYTLYTTFFSKQNKKIIIIMKKSGVKKSK